MYNNGFTLVELIIVITILAILGTIGFVTFSEHLSSSRDSQRLANINSIENGLQSTFVKIGKFPIPDDNININAKGELIGNQGYIGNNVSSLIKLTTTPIDPDLNNRFIYYTNKSQNKYQILTFLEN